MARGRAAGRTEPDPGGGHDRPVRPRAPEFVTKRDGRRVPFQRQKIAEAVLKAMEAAGEADPALAIEVAGVVELSLAARSADVGSGSDDAGVPHIETIQDLVERVLVELGKGAVAKAYILHRDLRARARAALRVHRSDALRSRVRVREREGVSDWSKGRIVAVLMQEAGLARELAEEVAAAVERRVFASGKSAVTTGLVRELVASELFERGLGAALSAARLVGLARHDVRRVLDGLPLHAWASLQETGSARSDRPRAHELLSGELLARYALDSVLPEAASELHRAGDIHVVGLESLGRPLTVSVEAELLAGGGDASRAAYGLLDALAEIAPAVARGLVLERPAAVLAPLARTTRENSPHGLTAWLRSLQALARASGVRIDLGTPGGRHPAFAARLIEELAELSESPAAPSLYLDGVELEELLVERADLASTVERLLATGRLAPAWSGPEEEFAGPGCTRRSGERGALACGAAVAINLPRIARRAGPFREELVQSALAELVQAAVGIAQALRPSFERGAARLGLFARTAVVLVPVGLREALWILGDGRVDVELCARLLGFLGEAARRFSRDERVAPIPCPFFGAEAAARFAYLDGRAARAAGTRQEWLFDAAADEDASTATERPYGQGFRLGPVAGLASGRAEAEALRTVLAGALANGEADSGPEARPLDAWRRFEVVRRARSGELVLELFPRPGPAPLARSASPVRPPTPLRPLV